ncbi:MAG: hypothetical protein IJ677_09100, partial [Alphaproteobacteria bacterium]|nr:hypothetical protein [Alphaproteobacteria bacterium]
MAVIEKVEQNVVDGNNVETTYYDNGDIRTVAKDSQDHEILNKLVNEEGEIRESVERTYYDNGQQATEIKIFGINYVDGMQGNVETTKWREDGQEIFYQVTNKNNEILEEHVYEFFENGNVKKCEYKDEGEVTKIEEFYENSQLKRQQTGPKDAKEKDGVYYSIAEYTEKGQLLHSEGRGWTPGKDSLGWDLCSRYEKNIEYYDNGNIKSEKDYARIESVRGRLQSSGGSVKNYYENGNVKSTHEDSFEHLEPTDCDREYDEKGKLVHYIKRTRPGRSYVVTELTPVYVDEKIVSRKFRTPHDGVGEELYNNEGYLTEIVLKGDGKTTSIKFDGKTSFNINEPSDMSETPVYLSNYLTKIGIVSLKKVDDKGNIIDEEHYENGVLKSFKHFEKYNRGYAWEKDYVIVKEEKNENGYSYFEKSKDGYEIKTHNAEGKPKYYAKGPKEGEISYMAEYDAAGEKLQRSIETLKDGKMKFTEYGEAETVETIKNTKGEVISETVITYHDDEHKKIATSKTTSPKNLAELTIAYNEAGKEIFKQRVGAFGRLVELYEAYPNGHKKHHITTNADGSQEEKRWNENGVETFYETKDIKGNASNQTFYPSGRVQMESIDDGMIIYWDTEKNNVK